MKWLKVSSIALVLQTMPFLNSFSIYARGSESSGGGGAFVCRDRERKIIDSELLDLWESKNLFGHEINYSDEPIDIQIKNALTKITTTEPFFANEILKESLNLMDHHTFLPAEIAIRTPVDTGHEYEKPNCPLEGMMYYDGEKESLKINKEIFSKLQSKTDIAASFVHEGAYKVFRKYLKHDSSKLTRKLVGFVFAYDTYLRDLNPIEQIPHVGTLYKCAVNNQEYYYFPTDKRTDDNNNYPIWRGVFTKINGEVPKDIVEFSAMEVNRINNLPIFEGVSREDHCSNLKKIGLTDIHTQNWESLGLRSSFDFSVEGTGPFINYNYVKEIDYCIWGRERRPIEFLYFMGPRTSHDEKDFQCSKIR